MSSAPPPKKSGDWGERWNKPPGRSGFAWETWPPMQDNGKPNLDEWFPKKPRMSEKILHPELDDTEYVRGFHVTALIYGKRSHRVYEAGGFCTQKAPSRGGARQAWRMVQGAPSDWFKVWKTWCDSRNLRVARPPPWLQRTVGTQTGDVEELCPETSDAGTQTSGLPGVSADSAGQPGAGAAKAADSARRPPQGDPSTTPDADSRKPKRSRTDPTDLIDLASSGNEDVDDEDKRGARPWRGAASSSGGPCPKDSEAKKDDTKQDDEKKTKDQTESDPPPRREADNDARPDPGATDKAEEERRPDDDAAQNAQPAPRPRQRGRRSGRKVREREGRPTPPGPPPRYFEADPQTTTPPRDASAANHQRCWSYGPYGRSMGGPRPAQACRDQQAGPSSAGGYRQGGWGPAGSTPAGGESRRGDWGPSFAPGTPSGSGSQQAPSRSAGQSASAPRDDDEWRRYQEWRREEEERLFQQWRERGGSKGDRR